MQLHELQYIKLKNGSYLTLLVKLNHILLFEEDSCNLEYLLLAMHWPSMKYGFIIQHMVHMKDNGGIMSLRPDKYEGLETETKVK